jgi:hypothetical protein
MFSASVARKGVAGAECVSVASKGDEVAEVSDS